MIIKKEKRKEKQTAKDSFVFEYETKNKDLGIALAKINGRFPDSGKVMNKVCQETYFVVDGSGKIFIENKEFELNKDDVFLIEPGKKYYVVGKDLVLVCSTAPSWYPEQFVKEE